MTLVTEPRPLPELLQDLSQPLPSYVRRPTVEITSADRVRLRLQGGGCWSEYIDLWGFTVLVSINQTQAQMRASVDRCLNLLSDKQRAKIVRETRKEHRHEHGCHIFYEKLAISVIRVHSCLGEPGNFNTLAHEILHSVHYLLDSKGLELTKSSQEAYAYLTGYLMEQTLWMLQLPDDE